MIGFSQEWQIGCWEGIGEIFLVDCFSEDDGERVGIRVDDCDGGVKLLNDSIRSSNSLVTVDFFDDDVLLNQRKNF